MKIHTSTLTLGLILTLLIQGASASERSDQKTAHKKAMRTLGETAVKITHTLNNPGPPEKCSPEVEVIVTKPAPQKDKITLNAKVPFHFSTDTMCFSNNGKAAGDGPFPFDYIAEKFGSCQGISGLASAFSQNVEFDPKARPLSEDELKYRVSVIESLYMNGCPDRVVVPGFPNLFDVCSAHEEVFKKETTRLNLSLYIRTATQLSALVTGVSPEEGAQTNLRTLRGLVNSLKAGKQPLILIRTHVMSVHAIETVIDKDNNHFYRLKIYDSNMSGPRWIEIPFSPSTERPSSGFVFVDPWSKEITEYNDGPIWEFGPDGRDGGYFPQQCEQIKKTAPSGMFRQNPDAQKPAPKSVPKTTPSP